MNKRAVSMVSFSFAVLLFGACDKPSESECKKAVTNIRQIMGTSKMSIDGAQDAAWVRSCRGTAQKKSVSCAIEAKNLEGLKACGLLKGVDLDALMQVENDLKKLQQVAPPPPPPAVVVDAGSDSDAGTGTVTATDAGTGTVTATDAGTGTGAGTGSAAPKPATP